MLLPVLLLMNGCDSPEIRRQKALQDAMKENEKCINLRQADIANVLSPADQAKMEDVCGTASRMIADAVGGDGAAPTATATPTRPATWRYLEEADKIRGGKRQMALIDSDEKLSFNSPYGGGSTATLGVRKTPAYGSDVTISVDRGQFKCSSFNNDQVSVRFDDRPIEKYICHEPSDGRLDVIFLTPFSKFLRNIKLSKKVIIEVEFFQNGVRQIEFNSSNLKWDN